MNPRYGLQKLEILIEKVKSHEKKPNIPLIKKAFFVSRKMHEKQFRASKDPYFYHPLETAIILADLGADSETIAAALLHDVLEDTAVTHKRMQKLFGPKVTELVEGVTKVDIISQRERNAKQIASLQKIFLATVSDIRVLFIKLADKLHNLRTIKYLPKTKQKEIASHALEVYAPLAHKLGLHGLKSEMEERCFAILEPQEYSYLKKQLEERRKKKSAEIRELIKEISRNCRIMKKNLEIYTLQKGVYQIFKKIVITGKSLEEIYDYTVVVIIVSSERECYECLGLIHSLFLPVAKKLKDYIAIPQSNSYKSIHTTVIGPHGNPVKIYIRTREMDNIAEKGMIIAKKFDKKIARDFNKKMAWMRHALGKELSAKTGKKFLDSLKTDFLDNAVLFFDRHGRIHELPFGSTPLDFAFHQNEELALRFRKAKVNGKEVPPWYEIQSGDIVEFSAAKRNTVSRRWLSLVKSKNALNQIQKFLNRKHKKCIVAVVPATKMKIVARDRMGLFFELTKFFRDRGINIESFSASSGAADKRATVELKANFCDKEQMEKVIRQMKKNKNVLSVQIY